MVEGGSPEAVAERLSRLQRVTDAALAHLTLDDLLDELLDRVREILEADTCAFLLLDEEANELVARAARGIEEEVERGVRIPVGRGFAGRIAAERRPISIDDVDHADILNPILREKGIKSLLGAPLIARGRVLGVLHVGTLRPHHFEPYEVDLLQLAAERAAMGIDKALIHADLLRVDALRHQFIATASHELRTPVASVLGAALTLDNLEGRLTPEQEAQLMRIMVDESTRLAVLVDQLLDFSRLEAQAVAVKPERVRLRERLDAIIKGVDSNREVTLDVDPELEIETDLIALDRIVTNLVDNAFSHGSPPFFVRAARSPSGTSIAVEDRGRGVAPDFRKRLFEEFTRSPESPSGGSGLGLAIARSYANAIGGDLSYEDAKPHGARFALLLPVVGL